MCFAHCQGDLFRAVYDVTRFIIKRHLGRVAAPHRHQRPSGQVLDYEVVGLGCTVKRLLGVGGLQWCPDKLGARRHDRVHNTVCEHSWLGPKKIICARDFHGRRDFSTYVGRIHDTHGWQKYPATKDLAKCNIVQCQRGN